MAEKPVAVVTGAGSGIGRAVCVLLSAEGWRIVLVGRTESTLLATRELMVGCGDDDLLIMPADVADPRSAGTILGTTTERWGRLDGVVNNAAIVGMGPIERTDQRTLEAVFAANTFGPAYLITAAWPIFVERGGGRIVNVSSVATSSPFPGLGVYAASKAAIESLTRSIMVEGEAAGIRAFSIRFGAVETPMLRSVVSRDELPEDQALDPAKAAEVIVDCLSGRRDDEAGTVIT